jgi:hypothetical protein
MIFALHLTVSEQYRGMKLSVLQTGSTAEHAWLASLGTLPENCWNHPA